MPGFPPLDCLVYNNPPARIGSWMLIRLRQEIYYNLLRKHNPDKSPKELFDLCFDLALQREQAIAFDPLYPEYVEQQLRKTRLLDFDPVRVQKSQPSHFASLSDLVAFLRKNHRPHYRYRGQTRRYRTTYLGSVPGLEKWGHINGPITVRFEGLIPSVFRNVISSDPANWNSHSYPAKLEQVSQALGAIVRSDHEPLRSLVADYFRDVVEHSAIFAKYALTGRVKLELPLSVLERFAPGTMTPNTLLRLISVQQHYGRGSVMIDVSTDMAVATWFATHHFSTGDLVDTHTDALGVMYRFDADAIKTFPQQWDNIAARQGNSFALHSVRGPAGLVGIKDIAEMDVAFGLRPRAQAGGSILGLENSAFYLYDDLARAIEVFTFPISSVTGRETPLEREDICPRNDPAEAVFNNTGGGGNLPEEELKMFLGDRKFSSSDVEHILTLRREGLI